VTSLRVGEQAALDRPFDPVSGDPGATESQQLDWTEMK
jgi:hypothetical protein